MGAFGSLDLEEGDVGFGVLADNFGLEPSIVQQAHLNVGGVLDDVVIGQSQPGVADDEP